MLFHYRPEGASAQTWEFRPERLMNAEAEAIEKRTGMTFGEWADALERNSMIAVHALLWVLRKRAQPNLTYDQVEFSLSEVELELQLEDKILYRDHLSAQLAAGSIDPELRDDTKKVLAALEEEIAAERSAGAEDEADATGDPKEEGAEPPSTPTGGLHSLPNGESTPVTSIA